MDSQIHLPPLEIQRQIVSEIESYEEEITNYKLEITKKQNQIKSAINKVLGVNENEQCHRKKSFAFTIRIVNVYKFLTNEKK